MPRALLRLFFAVSLFSCIVFPAGAQDNTGAQDNSTPLEVPTEEPPVPSMQTTVEVRAGAFRRTVIVVLGGVTWRDFLALASQTSTATPGLRKVLEEGALGAAYLPRGEQSDDDEGPSEAMLRAALILSSGKNNWPYKNLPAETAWTIGPGDNTASGPFEEGNAAAVFARRTGRTPLPDNLINLGWGALLQRVPHTQGEIEGPAPGSLAEAFHLKGGKTAALGSGDTAVELGDGEPLREWALVACDRGGVADAGDVSNRLLARDKDAPYGLRSNRKAVLAAIDKLFADGQTGLVTIEWGDTRRAAEYSRLCSPETALTYREAALRSADAFIQELAGGTGLAPSENSTARLSNPIDRLVIIAIPKLHSGEAQWLPVVYWHPGRNGQGPVLERKYGGEGPGDIGLDNLHSRLLSVVNVEEHELPTSSLKDSGLPQSATARLSRLIAMQSGLSWLESARKVAQGIWCALFVAACAWTLWVLRHPGLPRAVKIARHLWCAAMVYPWILWLAGLCVQTTWRLGSEGANFKLSGALLLIALLMWFLIGATFNWFGHARLQRIRIGALWFVFSVVGLWIGGFALPWNALLYLSRYHGDGSAARSGEVWSLLFISATLLAISGLTKSPPASHRKNGDGARGTEPLNRRPSGPLAEEVAANAPRRVLNLRPAFIWALAIVALLAANSWGRSDGAAIVAAIGVAAMWLRLWLERAPRDTRRRIVFAVAAVGILLLWQRGAMTGWDELYPHWSQSWRQAWQAPWWDLSLVALLALVWAFAFTAARDPLRNYLAVRYSLRAMLSGAAVAAVAGFVVFGPAAPPLIATFTLGALVHELLGTVERPVA